MLCNIFRTSACLAAVWITGTRLCLAQIEPTTQKLSTFPAEFTLKRVEVTFTAAEKSTAKEPDTGGTIESTTKTIERQSAKKQKTAPKRIEQTITTIAPQLPQKAAKPAKPESTSGTLTYSKSFNADSVSSPVEFMVPENLASRLEFKVLRIAQGTQTAAQNQVVGISLTKTNSQGGVAGGALRWSIQILSEEASGKPSDYAIEATVTLVPAEVAVSIVSAGDRSSPDRPEVMISNHTAVEWPKECQLTIKNGSDVVYRGTGVTISVGASVTLNQKQPVKPKAAISLKQINLSYTPAATVAAATSQQTGAPAPAPAATLALGTQQTTTESIEEPKGNVREVKTTTVAVSQSEPAKSTSTPKGATTTGEVVFESDGLLDFDQEQFVLRLDPATMDTDKTSIRMIDEHQRPAAFSMESDKIDPSKVTAENPQKKIVTVMVKAAGNGKLRVRATVPLNANAISVQPGYAAILGDESRLISEFLIQNSSTIDLAAGYRLQIKSGDQVLYDRDNGVAIPSQTTQWLSQKLSAVVDARTIYVDLGSLLDGAAAKPENIARLPRTMMIDNNRPCAGGWQLPLPTALNLQLRGDVPDGALVKLPTSVTLSNPLPLGSNCSQVPAQGCCCSPMGTCADGGPLEESRSVAYVNIGEDPRIGIIGARKSKEAPLLPLSFVDGKLTYLTGEHWSFQVCASDAKQSPQIRFYDSRKGMAAVGSPALLTPANAGSPMMFQVDSAPWSINTNVQSFELTDANDAEEFVALLGSLDKAMESFRATKSPGQLAELASFFCLDPQAKAKLADIEAAHPGLPDQAVRQYLDNLKKQLSNPIAVAGKHQKLQSKIVANRQKQASLSRDISTLTSPDAGDTFGVRVLKNRLQLEQLQAEEKNFNIELSRLSSELVKALADVKPLQASK